jgi:class 3 adenylate cyclase
MLLQRVSASLASVLLVTLLVIASDAATIALPTSIKFGTIRSTTLQTAYGDGADIISKAQTAFESLETIAGIAAAFKEANDAGGLFGIPFVHQNFEFDGETQIGLDNISTATDVLAWGIPDFSTAPAMIMQTKAVGKPLFGGTSPTTAFYDIKAWKNAVFLRLPFQVDTNLMVTYATQSHLRCYRTAVLYYDDPSVKILANDFVDTLASIYYPRLDPIAIDTNNISAFIANVTRVIRPADDSERASCICILYNVDGLVQTMQMLALVPGFNASDYNFLAPSVVFSASWQHKPGFNLGWYDNLYAVSQFPHPKDSRYTVSKKYLAAMQTLQATGYALTTVESLLGNIGGPRVQWEPNAHSLEAYITARFFIDAVRATSLANMTSAAVLDAVYRQKLFMIDDWQLGPYNDGCVGRETETAPFACSCMAGTKRLFLTKVNATSGLQDPIYDDEINFEVGIAELAIPSTACEYETIRQQNPVVSPNVHFIVRDPTIGDDLTTLEAVVRKNMYSLLQLFRVVGVGKAVDVDIVLGEVPPDLVLSAQLMDMVATKMYRVQGYVALATEDPDLLEGVTAAMMFAPLRYRYIEKDPPMKPYAEWNPMWIPFFPSLTEMGISAVAWATAPGRANTVHVITDTALMAHQMERSLHHFQRPVASSNVLFDNAAAAAATVEGGSGLATALVNRLNSIFNQFGDSDYVLVASQNVFVLATLTADFAQRHLTKTVVLISSEFVLYDAIINISAISTPTISTNLYYISPLPYWCEAGGTYVTINPIEAYTAVIAGVVYLNAGSIINAENSASNYAAAMYTTRTIGPTYTGIVAGPFSNVSCGLKAAVDEHPASSCQCNKALRTFYVRGMAPWISALRSNDTTSQIAYGAVAAVGSYEFDSCGFEFQALRVDQPDMSTAEIVGTVLALVLLALVSVLTVFLIVRAFQRDNSCAPKDATKPFAMAFTDIQSSTSMWARAPNYMGPAVDLHHELIRGVIKKHKGYEVKTIGDSFMVAFKDAAAAVKFAMALQDVLYDADWGTEVFDETYKELIADAEHKRALEDAVNKTESANVTPAIANRSPVGFAGNTPVSSPKSTLGQGGFDEAGGLTTARSGAYEPYNRQMWRGLRVRVGIHYGLGEIKLDRVSKGYDYYGTVVNTAARVEGVAHGGQIVVTQAVMDELLIEKNVLTQCDTAAFGPQPLRGLDTPIPLVQVLPTRFVDRSFPPLRLDVEKVVEESEDDDDAASDRQTERSTTKGSESRKYSMDDFVGYLIRHHPEAERPVMARRITYGRIMLDTMMSTSSAKYRDTTTKHLVEKWRIDQLKKKPGMGKYRRSLSNKDFLLTLLSLRISMATESQRLIQDSTDTQSALSDGTRANSMMRVPEIGDLPPRARQKRGSKQSDRLSSNADDMTMTSPMTPVQQPRRVSGNIKGGVRTPTTPHPPSPKLPQEVSEDVAGPSA